MRRKSKSLKRKINENDFVVVNVHIENAIDRSSQSRRQAKT